MDSKLFKIPFASLLVTLSTNLGGCGQPTSSSPEVGPDNLRKLAAYFVQYVRENKGSPPNGYEEFKQFIEFKNKAIDIASLFKSPRDGEPFEIIFKPLVFDGAVNALPPVIAYEKTGVKGKRYVVYPHEEVEEVDEAKFRKLVPETTHHEDKSDNGSTQSGR